MESDKKPTEFEDTLDRSVNNLLALRQLNFLHLLRPDQHITPQEIVREHSYRPNSSLYDSIERARTMEFLRLPVLDIRGSDAKEAKRSYASFLKGFTVDLRDGTIQLQPYTPEERGEKPGSVDAYSFWEGRKIELPFVVRRVAAIG